MLDVLAGPYVPAVWARRQHCRTRAVPCLAVRSRTPTRSCYVPLSAVAALVPSALSTAVVRAECCTPALSFCVRHAGLVVSFCVRQAAGDATLRAHLHRSSCALLRVRTAWSGSVLSEHLQSTTEAWLVQSSPQELAPLFDTTASDDPWKVCCAHLWHKPTHTQTNVTAEDGRSVQGSLARHFSNVSCVSSQSAATSTVSSPAPSPSGRSPANSAECALASRLATPQSLGAFACRLLRSHCCVVRCTAPCLAAVRFVHCKSNRHPVGH